MGSDHGSGSVHRARLSVLVNRYVVIAFVAQTLSSAALVGFVEHGDTTSLVGLTRRLPTSIAAVLGVFAIPALLVTLLGGVAVEYGLGISPQNLGIGLVSGTDGPFLVVAYFLSIGVARLVRRRQRGGET